jgi:FMN phosphatase YigB (HAD superfamily)
MNTTSITQFLKRALFSLFTLIGISTASGKYIMWDMGHVLVEPNKLAMAFGHIGVFNVIGYSEDEVRTMIYDIQNTARLFKPENTTIVDDRGHPLCLMHCQYLAGMYSSKQLWSELQASINLLEEVGYFRGKRQRRLAEKILQIIYNPEVCARYMVPNKKGVSLLKKCAEKTADGKPCHEMMILSNWDKESFPLLQANPRNNKIFKHFVPQNIIISGAFGHMEGNKPFHWLYNYVIASKQAQPSDFVFIDDQIANVEAARACGIYAIHLKNGDYKAVEAELKQIGVL